MPGPSYTLASEGELHYFNVGDSFVYRIDASSDYDTAFAWLLPPVGIVKGIDAAQTIAGRQRQWDDSVVVGELYKFGQCYAICTGRSPAGEVFVSEAENEPKGGGVTIEAEFSVVRPGYAVCTSIPAIQRNALTPGNVYNGTQTSHLFRAAISSFIVDRATQVIEIGYKSSLGIRYSGLCNFRDAYSGFWSDLVSCDLYNGAVIGAGQTLNTSQLTSGTISLPEKRYSFFRIGCRPAGSDAAFTELDVNFCIASQTQQSTYNYIRLQFPSAQRWEIQHLPLTGWEIRNNLSPGPLVLLDSRMAGPAKTGSSNGFVFNYSGESLAPGPGTFGLAATIPQVNIFSSFGDLGVGPKDEASYADAYGALAEIFAYEEIQTSANQPEHEIAYVNLISPNPSIPTYEGISTVGLTLRSGPSFNELNQFSVYVNCGFGATHVFPEVLAIMLTNERFGAGDIVSPAQIDFASFYAAGQWTYSRRYFFDMGISDPINIRGKGAELAKLFLLDLSTKNGKFHLSPIAEFGKQYTPTALFTAGNADAVTVAERDSQERQPIRVSVKWREERQASDLSGRGLFPVIRELTVREAGTPDSAPLVQLDISEFGTSERHAVDAAKMRCREQRLITHDITIECLPDRNALEPGAIIKVGMEVLAYEQPNNGVILADGSTTTTAGTPLANGTYNVVLWDGSGELQEVAIVVTAGKVVGYSNAVFCIADSVQATQTFKAQVISYNDEGNLEITASYFPLDGDGRSLLLEDWDDPDAWVIEGLIGELPPDVPLEPPFAGVNVIGPLGAVDGSTYMYIAEIDGPEDTYTYAWTGTGVTFDDDTSKTPEVTFAGVGTATLNVTATRTSDSLDRSGSRVVTVTAPTGNAVTIDGPDYRIGSGDVVLTANIALPFTTATYEWTMTGEGTLADETTDTVTITFSDTVVGSRFVNLNAVVDGVVYPAIKLVSVFAEEPLTIDGADTLAPGTSLYEGILGASLPTDGWTFEWSVTELPTITLSVAPASVVENSADDLVFTFTRTGDTTEALTVNYTIAGTAVNGTDYDTIDTSVVIGAGDASADVLVTPIDNADADGDRTVSLQIAAGTGYVIGTVAAVVGTIEDDDAPTFDPLTLSPVAWWDASDASTITTSGGKIQTWADKSGNGLTLSEVNVINPRPDYTTAAMNGLNAAEWPAGDNGIALATASAAFAIQEMYVVLQYDGSAFTNFDGILGAFNNTWYISGNNVGTALQSGTFDGAFINGNNGTNRFSNVFTEIQSPCLLRVKNTTAYSSTTRVGFGMDRNLVSLGRGWSGYIGEMLVFDTLLPSGDRTDLETYLMDKWGI